MESEKSIYYIFKYLPGTIGVFLILMMIVLNLVPEFTTFHGEPGPPDIWLSLIFILVGVLLILIPFIYIHRLVIVEINYQKIKIKKDGEILEVNWLDVEEVSMVPSVIPPLYKLRLKKYGDYFLFNTTHQGIQFMTFTWDWSEMGELIKRKKKELDV